MVDLQIRKMQAKIKDTENKLEIAATIKAGARSIEEKSPIFFSFKKKVRLEEEEEAQSCEREIE